MSEPKVAELLRSVGVQISDGQVSNMLIKDHTVFHAEKAALYQAGLASSPWQHLDDTSTRVNGQNGYCHIVCNPHVQGVASQAFDFSRNSSWASALSPKNRPKISISCRQPLNVGNPPFDKAW